MKIRHLYGFLPMFMLFPVYTLLFLSEITLFAIFDNEKRLVSHATKPNKRALFSFIKTSNNSAPQTTIKQARFYKPCIYDKQLGFNKPAVVIADSLFAVFRHLCINGCLCDMRHIRSKSGFGTNTPKSPTLAHKQALIENYYFYDQTTHNYSTANSPNKIICILHHFHVKNHNYANSY